MSQLTDGIDALPLLLKAHQDAAEAQKKTIGLLEHRIMDLESAFQRQINQNQQLATAIQQMRSQQSKVSSELPLGSDNVDQDNFD